MTETFNETKKIFRYLHQHPELSFQEHQTREFILQQLQEYGYENIKSNVGGGGIIARLKGRVAGPTIAFRADFDALTIQEETGLEYQSINKGAMHACGHDAHTTILLTAAKLLKDIQAEIKGTILFLFQHAEELKPGGAKGIIESGELDDVDAIYGFHVRGDIPYDGVVEYCPGYALAASDSFSIRVQGNGGHAATPHKTVDSTLVAAFLIQQLQTIISRNKNPLNSGVLTVANFHSGTGGDNIIADYANISGTVRSFNPALRVMIKKRIHEVSEQICSAHGATVKINYLDGYPPLFNYHEETKLIKNLFIQQFGEHKVVQTTARMGGEDFAYYLEKIPGSYYYIRAGAFESDNYPHHHPKFQIDERCILTGVKTILTIVNHYHSAKEGVLL
ncbi:M20 family metallopeptidase [Aerococcaceae bacterium WGS1372]